ncbi:MAG: NADH-quinone oxidoreductase subunit D-related protein [bacterium]
MKNKLDFLKNLNKDVKEAVTENFYNQDNELVLKINLKDLKKVCLYFFKDLKFYLLSAFAADESKNESKDDGNKFKIRYIFSHSSIDLFIIIETETGGVFPSLSEEIPALNWYEREMKDLFGLIPEGHPDPRPLMLFPENYPQDIQNIHPLRKDYPFNFRPEFKKYGEYNYNKDVKGDGVFNILVGPVHAGIIEPGHFRFSMSGEPILQLEIRHFWKHRGIEKIAEGKTISETLSLAEKISGDHCVAHSLAFLTAAEKILNIKIPENVLYIRTIYAELERLLCNINDFAWLFQDAGYSFGAQETFVLKEDIMELNKYLSGSRFNKGILSLGGINTCGNIDNLRKNVLKEKLSNFKKRYLNLKKMLLNSSTIGERFEETGYINKETILDLCALGFAARASGVPADTRKEHPYLIYDKLHFNSKVLKNRDVFARLLIRFYDIEESFSIITQCLNELPAEDINKAGREYAVNNVNNTGDNISKNKSKNDRCIIAKDDKIDAVQQLSTDSLRSWALGYCESQRGNIMHFVELDEKSRISRWKIRDPSFHNWQLIEFAVIGDIIADFPIVNKSLNLSYAGNDL